MKFHTKYLTHALEDMIFKQIWNFKSSRIYELIYIFEMPPGVGVTKQISSTPLFSKFFNIVKTHVRYLISR